MKRAVTAEIIKTGRWKDVTGDVMTQEQAEIVKDDVLDVRASEIEGQDQGNYITVPPGEEGM